MGKFYFASSLGTPEEMSELNSKRISSDVRKNSLPVTAVGREDGDQQSHRSLRGAFMGAGAVTQRRGLKRAPILRPRKELTGPPFIHLTLLSA